VPNEEGDPMPTIFSHPAVPLAIGLGLGPEIIPGRLLVAGVLGSMLPDLDVVAFQFGIPYGSAFGHRGASHSLFFALGGALLGTAGYRYFRASELTTFLFLFTAIASHGVLDSFTNGGHGIALLWPFSTKRFFAPFQFIEVSPIGMGFFSARGVTTLMSELLFVWVPSTLLGLVLWGCRPSLQARLARVTKSVASPPSEHIREP
jgi:inner membrane protein